jgi:uncharacterized protein YbbC (DUF1343 family)
MIWMNARRPSLALFCFLIGVIAVCSVADASPKVRLGNDILVNERLDLLRGKRVGLVINHTAVLSSGEFLLDVLVGNGINVVALFGPEHGVRGGAEAGETVGDAKDTKTGIPIFSLYGKARKPTPGMLANVDVLVYDVQDVGVRFYTYISTMGLCMEAAAEKRIPIIVLDRPNPLGGIVVDGPLITDSLRSFVGMYPIPVVYGLTCGELATMINGEGWLAQKSKCDLTVVKMEGWKREMLWEETGLKWIPPSPNIKTPKTTLVYPATCFIEPTNVSEGRGTSRPFHNIGAPFIDGKLLLGQIRKLNLGSVRLKAVSFVPTTSKHKGLKCQGIHIELEPNTRPFVYAIILLQQIRRLYPEHFELRGQGMLRLMGSRRVLDEIKSNTEASAIYLGFLPELKAFRSESSKYYLYAHPANRQ